MENIENLINLENKDGETVVSSREIARNFEKEHYHVTEAIENKIKNLTHEKSGVKITNLFIENKYKHKGNIYKEYLLTRDGFSFIVMGFTGKEADKWKLKYIDAFNKMEKALSEVYEISETAILNKLEYKLFKSVDERFKKYEENYRPTHKNKLHIDKYIKERLGIHREDGEVKAVKERVLLMLGVDSWQDLPYKTLIESMDIIDDSCKAISSFRSKKQMDMWDL